MKHLIKSITIATLLIFLLPLLSSQVFGQALVLPSMPEVVKGEGDCSDLNIGIASETWRVRKGDEFDVSVFQPFNEETNLDYKWEVTNGKILAGQSTPQIKIKAGAGKTLGFINATGFVKVALTATRLRNTQRCSVETSTTIMIGRIRESNGFAKIDSITVDKSELRLPCLSDEPSLDKNGQADSMIANILITASDPENDVLTYAYKVTGGKIVGSGVNVKWDLSGVIAGVYKVSVGVDDGSGIRNTKSAQVTVTKDDCRGK